MAGSNPMPLLMGSDAVPVWPLLGCARSRMFPGAAFSISPRLILASVPHALPLLGTNEYPLLISYSNWEDPSHPVSKFPCPPCYLFLSLSERPSARVGDVCFVWTGVATRAMCFAPRPLPLPQKMAILSLP